MRRLFALLAVAVAVAGSALLVPSASADAPPGSFSYGSTIPRRSQDWILLQDLDPAGSYQVTTDGGWFDQATKSQTTTVTPLDNGTAQVMLLGTSTLSASTPAVTLTLTSGGSVLDTAHLTFSAPELTTSACPGVAAAVGSFGLPDGSYHLTSGYGQFEPSTVSATGGTLGTTVMHAYRRLPANYAITLASVDSNGPVWRWQQTRRLPRVLPFVNSTMTAWTPWTQHWSATCFAPGERVSLAAHGAYVSALPATANRYGRVALDVDMQPGQTVRRAGPAAFTGAVSTQHVALPGGHTIYPTRLTAGQSLRPHRTFFIISGRPGGVISTGHCTWGTGYMEPRGYGSGAVRWKAVRYHPNEDDCTLTLQPHGNLTFTDSAGHLLWSSRTPNSGDHNYLDVTWDGQAEVRTAAGKVVWHSP